MAKCDHCKATTNYYVITGVDNIWCLDCMEYHGWEHLSAIKEATMKGGGSNGSRRTVPKRIANLSQDSWVETFKVTSRSKLNQDF